MDLGNYERFIDVTLTRDNNITTGKIYQVSLCPMKMLASPHLRLYKLMVSVSFSLSLRRRERVIILERQSRFVAFVAVVALYGMPILQNMKCLQFQKYPGCPSCNR